MKPGKKHNKEFKVKAVELANAHGNVTQIAREWGISPDIIYRWRREIYRFIKQHHSEHSVEKM